MEQALNHARDVRNHHTLADITPDENFPSVLSLSDFLTAERLNREAPITPAQWARRFCGTSEQHPRPMNVCLHVEETQEIAQQVAFDINSFLGFVSSLAVAR